MAQTKGSLIVIEGLDGTGKTVQSRLMTQRLERVFFGERRVEMIDFPRYDHPTSYCVQKYLRRNGASKGYRAELSQSWYAPSILYALDRMDAANSLDEEGGNLHDKLAAGGIIVSNRYTQSNIGYQGAKIESEKMRKDFILWLYRLEYEWLKVPRPDLVIFLDLPPVTAREAKLKQLAANGGQPDMLEADPLVFIRGRAAYLEAASLFPKEWRVIDCLMPDNSRRKTEEEVFEEILQAALSAIQ
ncbi:MAG TPA: hypothetical protein VFK07_03590 [Candidatus Paceibacterota bacterium]|nr:hypothetical protein [Candidatus Paceibacterota bacterium]